VSTKQSGGRIPRILIVDDHEIVRQGIRSLIEASRPEWRIVGEGQNGEEAVKMVQELQPDVAVIDISMPVMNGLEAAKAISQLDTKSRTLIFTMHESDRLAHEVKAAGANGFVLKSQAARDLVVAIEKLLSGGSFFGPGTKSNGPDGEKPAPSGVLTAAPLPTLRLPF
jgi:DNA-binding NarL/FixJ family response regulator